MKKVFSSIILLIMAVVCFSSCQSDARTQLRNECEKMQSQLPIDMGGIGNITAFEFDENNNYLVVTMTINDGIATVADFRASGDAFKEGAIGSLDDDVAAALEKANVAYKFVITDQSNSDKVEYIITADEIRAAKGSN